VQKQRREVRDVGGTKEREDESGGGSRQAVGSGERRNMCVNEEDDRVRSHRGEYAMKNAE
jgi:hypothetical protein